MNHEMPARSIPLVTHSARQLFAVAFVGFLIVFALYVAFSA